MLLSTSSGLCAASTVLSLSLLPESAKSETPACDAVGVFLPPLGLGTIRWGDTPREVRDQTGSLRLSFVRSVSDRGKVRFYKERCRGSSEQKTYSCLEDGPAKARSASRVMRRSIMMAEYHSPGVSLSLSDSGALFETVHYQFCSHYRGDSRAVRELAMHQLQLCGVRLMFQSHALRESGTEPIDDNETRVLRALMQAYGPPLESAQLAAQDRLEHRSWCYDQRTAIVAGHATRELAACIANVVYAYDRGTQHGFVSFATPALYAYTVGLITRGPAEPHPHISQVDWYSFLLLDPLPIDVSSFETFIAPEYTFFDQATVAQHAALDPPGSSSRR